MDSKGKRYGEGVENMIDANRIHMYNLKREAFFLDRNGTEHFQLNPNNGMTTLTVNFSHRFTCSILPPKKAKLYCSKENQGR